MKRVLLIDSDENTCQTLSRLLEQESLNVAIASNELDAITLLNVNTFDLIVVEPSIFVGCNFSLFEWLDENIPQTKVILIGESPQNDLPANANIFIKPLDFVSVVNAVKTLLGSHSFEVVRNKIGLEDYIRLHCRNNETKALLVKKNDEKGLILLHDGKIHYSAHDRLKGEAALYKILSWRSIQFREVKIKKFPAPNVNKGYRFFLPEVSSDADAISFETMAAAIALPEDAANLLIPLSGDGDIQQPEKTGVQIKRTELIGNKKTSIQDENENRPRTSKRKTRSSKSIAAAIVSIVLLVCTGSFFYSHNSDSIAVESVSSHHVVESTATKSQSPTAPAADLQDQAADNARISLPSSLTGDNISSSEVPARDVDIKELKSIVINRLVAEGQVKSLPEKTILRLHGSNTVGAKLAPALVTVYLQQGLGAKIVKQEQGARANEVLLKAMFDDHVDVVEIHAHGSSTGFKDLEAGACDIGMASRRIKEKEKTALSHLGDMGAITNEHVIALDGIAVIVNKSNEIDLLSMAQLGDIFSGKIRNWSELGGLDGIINVYARDDNSGTYDTFKSLVLGKDNKLKDNAARFESNPELSNRVAEDPNGIGFTSLPNINKAKAVSVSDRGAAPIYPSFFTVATEDYPISRRLYLYTAANPDNKHVRDFIEFVHSYNGQQVVKDKGLVDMNIKTFFAENINIEKIKNPVSIKEYVKAIEEAKRLSLNFRFKSGEAELDNRGVRDLDRVVSFLQNRLDSKVLLAGFADNAGEYNFNLKLAKDRAETVANILRTRGIAIAGVYSGGEELPVATNESMAGREKNRRVEVWLK